MIKQLLKTKRDHFAKCMHDAMEIRQQYDGKTDQQMSTDEARRYDAFLNEADGLKSEIQQLEREEQLTAFGSEIINQHGHSGSAGSNGNGTGADRIKQLHRQAFRAQLTMKNFEHTPEYREFTTALASADQVVRNAYQIDNPAGGGFAVMPQEMVGEFLTLLKDLVFMRQYATTFSVPQADSLGVPAIDTDPSDSDWTSELGTGNEETTLAFGKRELKPSPVAKLLKLSKTLVRKVPDVDGLILDRLAYKMAITEEKAFLSGTGGNQPLGIFTASSNGISTGRDTTAANASSIVADDLMTTFYTLKAQYRKNATWMLNRTVVAAIRKLKDTAGAYLWQPGNSIQYVSAGTALIGSQPETLLGRPILESEYAPGTITTGLYTACVGDLSRYWIADALSMNIQTLFELYAASDQNGYLLRAETDGMPVLEEAFSRLKQA